MKERKELLWRILVCIVSGIILYFWSFVAGAVWIFQFLYVLLKNRRHKGMAEFCNTWVWNYYRFSRYMMFTTDTRPFPFTDLGKPMEPVEMKH